MLNPQRWIDHADNDCHSYKAKIQRPYPQYASFVTRTDMHLAFSVYLFLKDFSDKVRAQQKKKANAKTSRSLQKRFGVHDLQYKARVVCWLEAWQCMMKEHNKKGEKPKKIEFRTVESLQ